MDQEKLEALIDEIQEMSLYRLLRPESVPIVRNPFRHRARPKTAIIWEACMAKRADIQ
jgi:hypothetical protein